MGDKQPPTVLDCLDWPYHFGRGHEQGCIRPATRAELLEALDIDWAAAYEAGSGGHEHEHEQWVEAVLDAALGATDTESARRLTNEK